MMRNGSHSFKLKTPEGQLSDTVWLDVDIMGKLSAEDRPLALQQVMVEGTKNAVAGTHYIAFDDPVLAESMLFLPIRQPLISGDPET